MVRAIDNHRYLTGTKDAGQSLVIASYCAKSFSKSGARSEEELHKMVFGELEPCRPPKTLHHFFSFACMRLNIVQRFYVK
jgi:hypothetical protein